MPGREAAARRSPRTSPAESTTGPTGAAIDRLRRMILRGELVPGQQLRQDMMAEQLGVSRPPVREALRQLTAEGLLTHTRNVGYMVARMTPEEFAQVQMMRKALEDLVLERIPKPSAAQLASIQLQADAVAEAASRLDLIEMRFRNQDFHFAIFELSELNLIVTELRKIWTWAAPYHTSYLFSAEGRTRVLREHALMIKALKTGNNARLIGLMDEHRSGSEQHLLATFGRSH